MTLTVSNKTTFFPFMWFRVSLDELNLMVTFCTVIEDAEFVMIVPRTENDGGGGQSAS